MTSTQRRRPRIFAWWRIPTQDPEAVSRAERLAAEVAGRARRLQAHIDENHLGEALDAAFGAGRK